MTQKPAVRLFAILPRSGHSAVVFRRGPSKLVRLIRWDTRVDSFEPGQWFKGRIYERRADLSPSGSKLIYFAANQKLPYRSWTAVSKPPFLTALLLWPNGSTWGGGGTFESESTILLNQQPNLAEGFKLPKRVRVSPLGASSYTEEGFGIYPLRLERDGWRLVQKGTNQHHDPEIRRKRFTLDDGRAFELEMWMTVSNHGPSEPWEITEFLLRETKTQNDIVFGKLDWADIDSNGDILFAKEGSIFRLSPDMRAALPYDMARARQLCDFSDSEFVEVPPPASAKSWD